MPRTARTTSLALAAILAVPLAGSALAPAATAAAPETGAVTRSAAPPEATVGGLTIENSFVSSVGWVKPGAAYPFRVVVRNPTTTARAVRVAVAAAPGSGFVSVRPALPSGGVTAARISWAPTVPAGTAAKPGVSTLVVQARAATLAQDPEVVWKDISSTATLIVGTTSARATSLGPKVIPGDGRFDSARYGFRPFPVVPVEYQDRRWKAVATGEKLDAKINGKKRGSGSTWDLYQEMSFGQLWPEGTVPSAGIPTRGYEGVDTTRFSKLTPQGTCTGVTLGDQPSVLAGRPRIVDGKYQLPGTTEYYGRDKGGFAAVGQTAGLAPLADIDGGCGPTAKSVYDTALIADPEIDYSDYDTDKDGVVDFFMMVFAGCGGNGGSQISPALCPTEYAADGSYDNIWPHSSSLEDTYTDAKTGLKGYISTDQLRDLEGRPLWYADTTRTAMTTADKGADLKVFVRVGPYNVNPETAVLAASVISHEYGHSLGLPDYYSTGNRETYGDWSLMATDKSHHLDLVGKRELGWVVPDVLAPSSNRTVNGWRDSKADTGRITWQRPDGTAYTLSAAGGDQGIHNGQAWIAPLPGRQLLDPKALTAAQGKQVWHSGSGNDFGCPPAGGHNLDIALPELKNVKAGTPVTLEFDSAWDIEWDYDYGFVMTGSRKDGRTTYAAQPSENGYTTATANPNTNGCQATYGNGLTGDSGTYESGNPVTVQANRSTGTYVGRPFLKDKYDISELVGTDGAVLRFSYATDPGLARAGWFFDNLVVKAGDQVVHRTSFETDGGPEDRRVFNGGCKDGLRTADQCTTGWNYVRAGVLSDLDHAYLLEMRDRSGFDNNGRGENDRDPIGFQAGLLLEYTDEAHGYGNVGTDDPPAQSPLDSVPQPGNDAPELDDAAFTAAAGRKSFTDNPATPHFDNYSDPTRVRPANAPKTDETASPWTFDFGCLSFDVLSMTGNATMSDVIPGDLTGNVALRAGNGCAAFDYGNGRAVPTPPAATGVTISTTSPQVTAGNAPLLTGFVAGAKDGDQVKIMGISYGETAYRQVATATVTGGVYKVRVAPTRLTAYVAQYGTTQSPRQFVRVFTRVNMASPTPGSTVGSPVTVSGSLLPAFAGVGVGVAEKTGTRYRYLGQGTTDSAGRFSFPVRVGSGSRVLVAYTSAHEGTDFGSKSATVTVR